MFFHTKTHLLKKKSFLAEEKEQMYIAVETSAHIYKYLAFLSLSSFYWLMTWLVRIHGEASIPDLTNAFGTDISYTAKKHRPHSRQF